MVQVPGWRIVPGNVSGKRLETAGTAAGGTEQVWQPMPKLRVAGGEGREGRGASDALGAAHAGGGALP